MNTFTVNTPDAQFAAAFKSLPLYLELQKSMSDDAVFEKACRIFFEEHPEVPRPKPVGVLDLVIDKEDALDIIGGKLRLIYGQYDDFSDELYDEDVLDFENAHNDDRLWKEMLLDFNDSVRGVLSLHLHDKEDSWSLDVECEENNTVMLNDEQIRDLQDRYDFHEFDDRLTELNCAGVPADERPIYFYFAIGKILKSTL